MKTIVCFKSYLGASEQYAKWIAEKTKADLRPFSESKNNLLDDYDRVVVISGTYAGQMPLVRFLKKHWKALSSKEVIVVAVGAAPADDPWSVKSYEHIAKEIRNKITYFKLPSSIDKKGREALKKSNINPVLDKLK